MTTECLCMRQVLKSKVVHEKIGPIENIGSIFASHFYIKFNALQIPDGKCSINHLHCNQFQLTHTITRCIHITILFLFLYVLVCVYFCMLRFIWHLWPENVSECQTFAFEWFCEAKNITLWEKKNYCICDIHIYT